jgi:hypothetical protein
MTFPQFFILRHSEAPASGRMARVLCTDKVYSATLAREEASTQPRIQKNRQLKMRFSQIPFALMYSQSVLGDSKGGGGGGRGLHTAVNSKINNLKCVFLGKYLDDFLF